MKIAVGVETMVFGSGTWEEIHFQFPEFAITKTNVL
jgi:hypothetical protein